MNHSEEQLLLITGATGFVGSQVAREALDRGLRVRALVRRESKFKWLQDAGVDVQFGSMTDAYSLKGAVRDATHIVHCAAKVGDWGPVEDYRDVNVRGFETMVEAACESDVLQRFVHMSSLGVYEPRDHHGSDETAPLSRQGLDAYTLTKVEAEELLQGYIRRENLPAVILRPGFVYGPRDRTVLPRILERLKKGKFKFIGSGEQLLNNVYVKNVADAVFLALDCENQHGEAFNITDGRLVTRHEFIHAICDEAGYERPEKHVPLPTAQAAAAVLEAVWKLLGISTPPVPSKATVKFLGYNLDYSIEKAKRVLGYDPAVDFEEGIKKTMAWAKSAGLT